MSQRNRRVLAALGLAAALCLILPAPSRAAGLWEVPVMGFTARVWSWLEGRGLTGRPGARPPAAVWEKEGSMIDPDGRPTPGTTSTPPPGSATSDQGSMIDPDGRP